MTEQNKNNREIFINLCKTIWDFDEKSMKYIENRTSDDWRPESDFDIFLKDKNFEDQRIRFELDMSKPEVQSFFVSSDPAYKIFKNTFARVLRYLNDNYNCEIGYKEFIENKCIFRKNITKIKKVFEVAYAENNDLFEQEFGCEYTKETCSKNIVKSFEVVGASKKSAKKLQMVISFNPIDWLMSSTSEDWSSCFNINNSSGGYQYCLGLPFQAGDKNRMMIYITDGSQKECMGIKVDHFQTRTWGILGIDDLIHIVKWYPNNTIGVKPVSDITGINKFSNNTTFSESKYGLDVLSTRKGAVINIYSDMGKWENKNEQLKIVGNEKDGQQIFTKNLIKVKDGENTSFNLNLEHIRYRTMTRDSGSDLGYRIPNWKKLGIHIDMLFPTLNCSICGEDKAGTRLSGSSFVCYDCYKDNVYRCYECGGEYFIKNNPYHVLQAVDEKSIKLCPNCFKDAAKRTCSCCGKYTYEALEETDDGKRICENCLHKEVDGYKKCSICQKISKNITTKYISFEKNSYNVCEDCSNKENEETFYIHFGKYLPVFNCSSKKKHLNIE